MITLSFAIPGGLSAGLTALVPFAIALCLQNDALAADIVLRVGYQKGGNRSLLEISGQGKGSPVQDRMVRISRSGPDT